jgi:YD repeat-containing protein
LARAEQNVAELLFSQGGQAGEFSGQRTFSIAKLGQVVLFFLHKAAERSTGSGPLHVNKLCWYADAENYRHYQVSITGARYARLPLGPVFDDYRTIFRELEQRGVIKQTTTDRSEAMQLFRPEELSSGELETLATRFKGKLARVVNESHRETAWTYTPHAKLISFKFSGQQAVL